MSTTVPREANSCRSTGWRSTLARSAPSGQRSPRGGGRQVLGRLRSNLPALRRAYRLLAADVRAGEPAPPAAEWLLDNFHLIEAEVRGVRHDLPAAYNRKLPRLTGPEHGGAARIEALARELVLRSDARLDASRLDVFLAAFQTATPLTLAEIWAWPSFLRAALVEHLRQLADELLEIRADRLSSGRGPRARSGGPDGSRPRPGAGRVRGASRPARPGVRRARIGPGGDPVPPSRRAGAHARGRRPRLAPEAGGSPGLHRERGLGPAALRDAGLGAVRRARQPRRGGAPSRSGRHVRPHGLPTRDRYRHAVEALAPDSAEEQLRVARRAVARAREAPPDADPREAHVGYFLVGPGRPAFEKDVGRRRSLAGRAKRRLLPRRDCRLPRRDRRSSPPAGLAAVAAYVRGSGRRCPAPRCGRSRSRRSPSPRSPSFSCSGSWTPSSRRAVCPRLDFARSGVPPGARTLVVFPTLFPTRRVRGGDAAPHRGPGAREPGRERLLRPALRLHGRRRSRRGPTTTRFSPPRPRASRP